MLAKKLGKIKGILWHQGESDANPKNIPLYQNRLATLFTQFRAMAGNRNLPIIAGELGYFSGENENWQKINEQIKNYAGKDKNLRVIPTADLNHKGDSVHFDSAGQRILGDRYAQEFLKLKKTNSAN